MQRLEEAGSSQVRQTPRVVAIGFVGRERLEALIGLPSLDAGNRKAELAQPVEKDRGHSTCFDDDPTTAQRFGQLVIRSPQPSTKASPGE